MTALQSTSVLYADTFFFARTTFFTTGGAAFAAATAFAGASGARGALSARFAGAAWARPAPPPLSCFPLFLPFDPIGRARYSPAGPLVISYLSIDASKEASRDATESRRRALAQGRLLASW